MHKNPRRKILPHSHGCCLRMRRSIPTLVIVGLVAFSAPLASSTLGPREITASAGGFVSFIPWADSFAYCGSYDGTFTRSDPTGTGVVTYRFTVSSADGGFIDLTIPLVDPFESFYGNGVATAQIAMPRCGTLIESTAALVSFSGACSNDDLIITVTVPEGQVYFDGGMGPCSTTA
jgi:hypothetical protein